MLCSSQPPPPPTTAGDPLQRLLPDVPTAPGLLPDPGGARGCDPIPFHPTDLNGATWQTIAGLLPSLQQPRPIIEPLQDRTPGDKATGVQKILWCMHFLLPQGHLFLFFAKNKVM